MLFELFTQCAKDVSRQGSQESQCNDGKKRELAVAMNLHQSDEHDALKSVGRCTASSSSGTSKHNF